MTKSTGVNGQGTDRTAEALERISLVLVAMYALQLEDEDQGVKVNKLRQFGFSNPQIANALGTTANAVKVALHRARRSGSSDRKKKAGKKNRRSRGR